MYLVFKMKPRLFTIVILILAISSLTAVFSAPADEVSEVEASGVGNLADLRARNEAWKTSWSGLVQETDNGTLNVILAY